MTARSLADILLVEQRDSARWLRLNRPQRRNALTPALIDALDTALADAVLDPDTTVIVIAGEGPTFCAGADLQVLLQLAEMGASPMPFLAAVSACFARIEQAPKPVVAAVHGHAVAGGLELALACDVVVAQEGTLIGDGHVRNALLPAGGSSARLPRKVGESLARWLMLTGQLLPADRFVPCGLVHRLAPAAEFAAAVDDVVHSLDSTGRDCHARLKKLFEEQREASVSGALNLELDAFRRHWDEKNVADALRRFFPRMVRP
jgi:enoyl-CoA hydratase